METEITLQPYIKMAADVVLPVLATTMGTLLIAVIAKFNAWLRSKVHSSSFDCASTKLDKLVVDAVTEAERTIVRGLQAAAEDGKITPDEGRKVRDQVVDVVKRHLGEKGLAELQECLGGLDLGTIEGLIRTRIEATLGRMADNAIAANRPPKGDDDDTGEFPPVPAA